MAKTKRRSLSSDEQEVLEHLRVRPVTSRKDIARCEELIVEHHYLHDATLVGEHLRYVATYKGRWLGVATWSAASFHIKARDEFIGWSHEQCRRRRSLLANNSRLLVLPECHYPNLISRFMKLMLGRLSQDWVERWGHPLGMVETFVDPQYFQGTAYKVSGWSHLGRTAGWKRDASDFYEKHDQPKQIWVRELVKKACVKLRAPELPVPWAQVEADTLPRCTTKVPQIRSLMELLRTEVEEFRRPQALAYPLAGMLGLILMAMATGVRGGPDDLAQFADTLSQGQLRALGFRTDRRTRQIRCPQKTTFHRVLSQIDSKVLEKVLLKWQRQVLGPTQDNLVVVDGKKLRHGGVEIVNAVNGSGQYMGGVMTEKKSNEIPAARQLLRRLDLGGKIVLADALHTNFETARQILYDGGGDYLLTVKGNQPTLTKTLEGLFQEQAFSPYTAGLDTGDDPRTQPRTAGDPRAEASGNHSLERAVSGSQTGRSDGDPDQTQRQVVS
jgi:hypothetical protein